MSLYKYLTIDTLKKVIAGNIRFTQPGAFNDPFELLPELYVPKSFSNEELKISFDVMSQRRSPPIGELHPDFISNECNDITSRKIRNSLNESIGILCLSTNQDSLLMWSHYADEYSGAMIEFDDNHEFFEGKIEVKYEEYRPIKNIASYTSSHKQIPIAELCVKSKEWEYESEVRIARHLSNCKRVNNEGTFPLYVMDIPQKCIKSIILGERTSINQQKEIWELIKETNISLYLSAIANWGYKFRRDKIKGNNPFPKDYPVISPRTAPIFKDYDGDLGELARWMIQKHELSKEFNQTV